MNRERFAAAVMMLIRMAGAIYPASAVLLRWSDEQDMADVERRLAALEDPVSRVHPRVPEVAEHLYEAIKTSGDTTSTKVEFDDDFYAEFGRPIAALDAAGHLKAEMVIGRPHPINVRIPDPTFLLYIASLSDDVERLRTVAEIVDSSPTGKWIDGYELAAEHDLPVQVVDAIFKVYEAKGYGLKSRTVNASLYMPRV